MKRVMTTEHLGKVLNYEIGTKLIRSRKVLILPKLHHCDLWHCRWSAVMSMVDLINEKGYSIVETLPGGRGKIVAKTTLREIVKQRQINWTHDKFGINKIENRDWKGKDWQ